MATEREKMLRGELYNAMDPELVAARRQTRELLRAFNAEPDEARRSELLARLMGRVGENVIVEPPFFCDYGSNITLGDNVFLNYNCVVLDVTPVTIGNDVLIGPAVQIYAATHPLDVQMRRTGLEMGAPIEIGDEVWIGGGALILPGVTIGARTVIGAGSVVTRDIPEGVFAAGNPCRVIRALE